MATEQNFSIVKGRTASVEVTVTDIDDWTGILAKLYAFSSMEESSVEFEVVGTIEESSNTVAFAITHDMTKALDTTSLYYEVVLYKADKTYLKDSNYGLIYIAPSGKIDPTV